LGDLTWNDHKWSPLEEPIIGFVCQKSLMFDVTYHATN